MQALIDRMGPSIPSESYSGFSKFLFMFLTRTLVLSLFIFYSKSHHLSWRRSTDHECSNAIQAASPDADIPLCAVNPCRSKDDLAHKPWVLESEYATGKQYLHSPVPRLNNFTRVSSAHLWLLSGCTPLSNLILGQPF